MIIIMRNLKCFVFDIDGTIVFNNVHLSKSLESEILKLSAIGMVIFATARPFRDVKQVLPNTLWSSDIVCMNGSAYYKNQVPQKVKYIKENVAGDVIDYLLSSNVPFVADNDEGFYLTNHDIDFFQYTKRCGIEPISNIEYMKERGVCKIQVFDKNHIGYFSDIDDVVVHDYSNVGFFDISSTLVDKSDLIFEFNLKHYYVTAFGNDVNDVEILKNSDLSICVGNNATLTEFCNYAIKPGLSGDLECEVLSFIQRIGNV
ncbi:hypothetical protein KP22_14205 [Pectobacterium betavasculorum]|uniref:Hydrolase n=2 Tax=Pectobacterium betavasculorum TaxID=55207 RepID=A0A093U6Z4_9GAMM|nr:hypothetical protein KP22_14205 [Pectobacterium betavasculorum]